MLYLGASRYSSGDIDDRRPWRYLCLSRLDPRMRSNLVFVFQTEKSSAPCTLRVYFLLGKNIKFAALVLTLIMVSAGVNAVRDAKLP